MNPSARRAGGGVIPAWYSWLMAGRCRRLGARQRPGSRLAAERLVWSTSRC